MEILSLVKILCILIILFFMTFTLPKKYKIVGDYLGVGLLLSAGALLSYLAYLNTNARDILEVLLWIALLLSFIVTWMGMEVKDMKTIKTSCNTFAIILIILIIFFI